MPLHIDINHGNGHRLIRATGEVDLNTSPDLRAAILKHVGNAQAISIDLSGVDYMDSSGVATLVEGLKSCTAQKLSFALINPSESVMKVLQLARLDTLFDIRDHMESA